MTTPAPVPELLETLEALEKHITWLYDEWLVYKDLYGTNQRRIQLLNDTAPHFFGVLQYTLRDSLVLQISRLTDNPTVAGRDTLVLKHLGELVAQTHPSAATNLDVIYAKIETLCKPIREWRHNKVAHLNRAAELDPANNPLTDFSRKQVHEAINEIQNYAQTVRREVFDGEYYYEEVSRWKSASPLLVGLIQYSEYAQIERLDSTYTDRLRQGKYGDIYNELEPH